MMGSINYPNTEKSMHHEKSTGGVELCEKTSITDAPDSIAAGFDGLTDDECKTLEKRRMYLMFSSPNIG